MPARLADLALRARRPREMGFEEKQALGGNLSNSSLRCQARDLRLPDISPLSDPSPAQRCQTQLGFNRDHHTPLNSKATLDYCPAVVPPLRFTLPSLPLTSNTPICEVPLLEYTGSVAGIGGETKLP
jgi:hypothetical protein